MSKRDSGAIKSLRRLERLDDTATEFDVRDGTYLGKLAEAYDHICELLNDVDIQIREGEEWKKKYRAYLEKYGSKKLAAELTAGATIDLDEDPEDAAEQELDECGR